MKRSTVSSKAIWDASSLEDCSDESQDSGRESEQTPATSALLVSGIKFNGVTAGSMIELTVQVLPDFYLESITLIKGGPADATQGTLVQGTVKKRGSASAVISAELYDYVLSRARGSRMLITLEHAETRVMDIRFENIQGVDARAG